MKTLFATLLLMTLAAGCNSIDKSNLHMVENYFRCRNAGNFDRLKMFLSDTIVEIEATDTMRYSLADYYEKFKWDSVFAPNYKIIDKNTVGNQVDVTISAESIRFKFLGNNPMQSKHKFTFKNNKISQIITYDYIDVNWSVWQQNRDSLISWVSENHPELNGFAHKMTKKGGEQYKMLIDLYTSIQKIEAEN